MSYVLSNISAFRYHRIPPQILALCPPIPDEDCDRQRLLLRQDLLVNHVLGFPLHTLVYCRNSVTHGTLLERHLWSGQLPSEAIWETDHGVQVTSPLFTLLTVAPCASETQLIMMAYEMCSTFAVFKPSDPMEKALKDAYASHQLPGDFGWKRSTNQKGEVTNLWQRPPLIQIGDLLDYAESNRSLRGGKKLLNAARQVSGVTASPFEVQAADDAAGHAAPAPAREHGTVARAEIGKVRSCRTVMLGGGRERGHGCSHLSYGVHHCFERTRQRVRPIVPFGNEYGQFYASSGA